MICWQLSVSVADDDLDTLAEGGLLIAMQAAWKKPTSLMATWKT